VADSKRGPRLKTPSSALWHIADADVTSRDLPPEFAQIRAQATKPKERAGIEIQVVHEDGEELHKKQWRAAEVWTRHRIYGLDSHLVCVEVLNRGNGKLEPNHTMLGSRLGGGRLRQADAVRFTYPFPLPGMEAMFAQGKKYGYTSLVERFVLRVRMLEMAADVQLPTWEDVAKPKGGRK
jgi:hypothetical protein